MSIGVFHALADPTRASIVEQLARMPATVGSLTTPTAISKPTLTRHLDVLQAADVITRERRGRTIVVSLNPTTLIAAESWLRDRRRYWEASLDRLSDVVEGQDSTDD